MSLWYWRCRQATEHGGEKNIDFPQSDGLWVDYFKKYPGRFPLWHLKDMSLLKGVSTELGKGDLNISESLRNADLSGVKYIFLEQEEYANNAFDSIGYNINYLAKLSY